MSLVITYGTFDLLHFGHLRILERAKAFGDRLAVGVSTDEFNSLKGKHTVVPYAERSVMVAALRVVDAVFPEESWDQKRGDIERLQPTTFVMGDDWSGRFDDLRDVVNVVYLARTDGISSTILRERTAAIMAER